MLSQKGQPNRPFVNLADGRGAAGAATCEWPEEEPPPEELELDDPAALVMTASDVDEEEEEEVDGVGAAEDGDVATELTREGGSVAETRGEAPLGGLRLAGLMATSPPEWVTRSIIPPLGSKGPAAPRRVEPGWLPRPASRYKGSRSSRWGFGGMKCEGSVGSG